MHPEIKRPYPKVIAAAAMFVSLAALFTTLGLTASNQDSNEDSIEKKVEVSLVTAAPETERTTNTEPDAYLSPCQRKFMVEGNIEPDCQDH